MKRPLLIVAILFAGCGGTFIGQWDEGAYSTHDFGAWRQIHVCVYRDQGLSWPEAQRLINDSQWPARIGYYYHLELALEDRGVLPSDSSWHDRMMDQVAAIPLDGDCDRVFYLPMHHAGDFLYGTLPLAAGLALPEVAGEVDDPTMTHGWAWANSDSPLMALTYGPSYVIWHEFYHLLGGCPDQWWLEHGMRACYDAIARLKGLAAKDSDFYPSWSNPADGGGDDKVYLTRAAVNGRLAGWNDPFWP
jgi:hypothetical protein